MQRLAAALAVLIAAPAVAAKPPIPTYVGAQAKVATVSPPAQPGVAATDWRELTGSYSTQAIRLSPGLVYFLGESVSCAAADTPELEPVAELLGQLYEVRVEVLPPGEEWRNEWRETIDQEVSRLEKAGWEHAFSSYDQEAQQLEVFVSQNPEHQGVEIDGLVVIAGHPQRGLLFVNLTGQFQAQVVGKHGAALLRLIQENKVDWDAIPGLDLKAIAHVLPQRTDPE